ncbi:MAG: hypothetical protein D6705_13575 [Deltaproteobacteria bacterium]|nr:MAG: hypothetical protein D6705_13575 [Deltaproteobacteria bacterium]
MGLAACQNPDVTTRTYFEQRIAPILDENCVRGTADNLCHAESTEMPGTALGNLDLSSFEAIHKRGELLRSYGSYPEPVLLMKAVHPEEVSIPYAGEPHPSEIFHAGGALLSRNSEAFTELELWLKNGATEDGVPPAAEVPLATGPCSTALRPAVTAFVDQATGPSFDRYVQEIEPIFAERCAAGTCHGSPQSDFYLTCGTDQEQLAHNYVVARSFVAAEADRSELLLRPLSPTAGGVPHTGGVVWTSSSDPEFDAIRQWAAEAGPLEIPDESPEFAYFRDRVMPVLLARGCAMPQCHSPEGFNDFRLRAGARGFFSPLALLRNYEATLDEFVSLDAKDPNESRILKKNIAFERGRIRHRAGPVLLALDGSDDGGNPDVCPEGVDEQPSSYCTVVEWIRRERAAAVAEGRVDALDPGDTVPIFYVDRPANPDRVLDFATYRGDAHLMRVDATVGPGGRLEAFSAPVEVDLSACTTATDVDVRRPEVSYDGTRLVFALRAGASDGLDIYTANLDGSDCVQLTTDGGQTDSGVPIHNFDPVFVPPDPERAPQGAIVFASTRPGKAGFAHVSPRWKLPASNLWRMAPDGTGLEQMTFLNGSELFPAVMQNGQITMTTEKATQTFYQLSGRRINWDLTDYHPLLAQRSETIGFEQATFIRESLDRNFLLIASDDEAWFSGGSLVSFNRSIGPFEEYRVGEPGYVPAVEHLDPAAARAGRDRANGAYRSPYPAPDGSILVSYAAGDLDLRDPNAPVDYDLVVFDPVTQTRTIVAGGQDGRFQVDGIVAYRRANRHLFENRPALVFGGRYLPDLAAASRARAHFPDLPMLATLLTSQNRGGRDLDTMDQGDTLAVYVAEPPPPGTAGEGTYQSWTLLGTEPLAEDGSAFVEVPAGVPVVLELRRGDTPVLTMTEEHQFGPGESTSLAVDRDLFDGVCGGCHGSIEGPELDVVVNPDALTAATVSLSRPDPSAQPASLGN